MSQPTNPFDDDNGRFYVLRNKEEQHSLWPTIVHNIWRSIMADAA